MEAISRAQQLLRDGRIAEAERAYREVLAQSPDHVEALNVVALASLGTGNCGRAIELLRRAVGAHPQDALSHYHLGRAHDEAGELGPATLSYQRALALQPEHFLGRLYLAHALDRTADPNSALQEYAKALQRAQKRGQWLDPASTPRNLQPLVERAVRLILDAKRSVAERVLSELTAQFGADALTRVASSIRIYLRDETPQPPDPRQQPTYLYFPDLPASAYLDRALFPWIAALEARTDDIRAELLRLLPSAAGRERVFLSEELERANLRGADARPTWNGYYFYRHGQRRDDNCSACPITAAAIDSLPLPRVPRHGPEVLFSIFTPGTHLLPHHGVTNTRLVAHLPLIVPRDCALNVGGELHAWEEGRVVVFDDTYAHEAWNRSDQLRVVLIVDVWNPYLTEVERVAVSRLVAELGVLHPSES
ncbi:MAG: aspartyl/asparaginyl beta-hydroxylase domain-containing protein [Steroidobacteraceae bacterium]